MSETIINAAPPRTPTTIGVCCFFDEVLLDCGAGKAEGESETFRSREDGFFTFGGVVEVEGEGEGDGDGDGDGEGLSGTIAARL